MPNLVTAENAAPLVNKINDIVQKMLTNLMDADRVTADPVFEYLREQFRSYANQL